MVAFGVAVTRIGALVGAPDGVLKLAGVGMLVARAGVLSAASVGAGVLVGVLVGVFVGVLVGVLVGV